MLEDDLPGGMMGNVFVEMMGSYLMVVVVYSVMVEA